MPSRRTWVLAAVAALVAFNVSAESLTVGSGVTVTAESKAYDGMTIQGTLVIPSGSAVTCTATRVSIDGGTILLNDGAELRIAGIDFGVSGNDSSVIFNGGQLTIAGQITSNGAGNLELVCTNDYDVALNYVGSSWIYLFAFGTEATGKAYVKGDNSFVVRLAEKRRKDAQRLRPVCTEEVRANLSLLLLLTLAIGPIAIDVPTAGRRVEPTRADAWFRIDGLPAFGADIE